MENLREIISNNIISLRKQNGMTQIDLSKKINYSDKALSRWEKGEVLPDIETIQQLSKIFNVSLTYMFEEHHETSSDPAKKSFNNALALHMLTCCALWIAITTVFVYTQLIYEFTFWQIFVWGVPSTILFSFRFAKKWRYKNFYLKKIL